MIQLTPHPDHRATCPQCGQTMSMRDWLMPGYRPLGQFTCDDCRAGYIGDLPTKHGLLNPVMIEASTGRAHAGEPAPWHVDPLVHGFSHRNQSTVPFEIESQRPPKRALLLNCLDFCYGHSLLALLNAAHHIKVDTEYDLVVAIPPSLRWLVPDGVAEIWTIDLGRDATQWNDGLARRVAKRCATFRSLHLSPGLPHPHPSSYDVEEFTRVTPFDLEHWSDRPAKVTYIWREDRTWSRPHAPVTLPIRPYRLRNKCRRAQQHALAHQQARRVNALANALRSRVGNLTFTVTGIGRTGQLAAWIDDQRCDQPPYPEQGWCEQWALSHVVVGVHGSGMLLASGHAGASVHLTPPGRWPNAVQDTLPRGSDPQDLLYRYRTVPVSVSPKQVAGIVADLVTYTGQARQRFTRAGLDQMLESSRPPSCPESRSAA